MNLLDPIPMALWSLSLLYGSVLLLVEWRKRDGLRRRVGLWLSLRIHALRDRLGEIEDLVDDVLVRA